jgi:signal transduction histidine kinase
VVITRQPGAHPDLPIVNLALRNEADVVLVRQRARLISELLGFSPVDQTRIATAVSEIARNAVQHGGGGRIHYAISGDRPRHLRITVEDRGRGFAELPMSPDGENKGRSGGVGIELSRRLMDYFEVRPGTQGGTVAEMGRALAAQRQGIGEAEVRDLVDELLRRPPESLMEELYQQQQELLGVLENLVAQQETLRQMNAELEETNRGVMALYTQVTQELDDTNRGVLALYAQLDDQTRELQRVNTLKDRFLSHLSHEFRTPLNSTLALSRLLLDRVDGSLSTEQERQVGFIQESAGELLGMVNDLLDLAKIEAGRLDLNCESFLVDELFSALRGTFRPLATEAGVDLEFAEVPPDVTELRTDQQKVAQVLRNFISNALKFTEVGRVSVGVSAPDPETVVFEVADTGIGIPAEDLDRIFEEFEQVAGSRQREVQGTGLGLSLSLRLAKLLGGTIDAESALGIGSTFRLRVPVALDTNRAPIVEAMPSHGKPARALSGRLGRPSGESLEFGSVVEPLVLVVDDDAASRYLVEHTLAPSGCRIVHASGREALSRARELKPGAIFLHLGTSGLELLRALKADPDVGDRPLIVYTSRELADEERRLLSGFALRVVTNDEASPGQSFGSIGAALVRATEQRVREEGG